MRGEVYGSPEQFHADMKTVLGDLSRFIPEGHPLRKPLHECASALRAEYKPAKKQLKMLLDAAKEAAREAATAAGGGGGGGGPPLKRRRMV
eukprot:PLAT2191.1.p2 GENE.PLAT2191.1~~PLAT2191.1.p2  ORF type:complete len:100 (+),score=11.38 PLAT2191.1:30-302(+)